MKFLQVEKLEDGTFKATYNSNADGSPTIVIYNDAQEADKALPVLDIANTDFGASADRAIFYFNDDDSINRSEFHLLPKDVKDTGKIVAKAEADIPDKQLTSLTDFKVSIDPDFAKKVNDAAAASAAADAQAADIP
jgi:hypothetical protein